MHGDVTACHEWRWGRQKRCQAARCWLLEPALHQKTRLWIGVGKSSVLWHLGPAALSLNNPTAHSPSLTSLLMSDHLFICPSAPPFFSLCCCFHHVSSFLPCLLPTAAAPLWAAIMGWLPSLIDSLHSLQFFLCSSSLPPAESSQPPSFPALHNFTIFHTFFFPLPSLCLPLSFSDTFGIHLFPPLRPSSCSDWSTFVPFELASSQGQKKNITGVLFHTHSSPPLKLLCVANACEVFFAKLYSSSFFFFFFTDVVKFVISISLHTDALKWRPRGDGWQGRGAVTAAGAVLPTTLD